MSRAVRRGRVGTDTTDTTDRMRGVGWGWGMALWLCVCVAGLAGGGDELEVFGDAVRGDAVDAALGRAADYLVGVQRSEGLITDTGGNPHAMTSLAILALASLGHCAADETPYGKAIRAALEYMLADGRQDGQGYYGGDGSRMYGHGIVALMLGEMLGMGVNEEQNERIRDRLQKAIDLILKAQRVKTGGAFQGGWRYLPNSTDSDLSCTIWQVMALRSAKNAGLEIGPEPIQEAVDYIKRSYHDAGSFAYQPGGGGTYNAGSMGLLALQLLGEYEAPQLEKCAEWLSANKAPFNASLFFYGTYYFAQGMYQRGGEYAAQARTFVEGTYLPRQGADGGWTGAGGHDAGAGRVYATSMAMLSLSVKYHYLPIYQR